jgi:hypothetical protein
VSLKGADVGRSVYKLDIADVCLAFACMMTFVLCASGMQVVGTGLRGSGQGEEQVVHAVDLGNAQDGEGLSQFEW